MAEKMRDGQSMRKLIGAGLLTVTLVLGVVAPASPADAHFVSSGYSRDLCTLLAEAYLHDWEPFNWRTIHYNSTHVTQCAIRYKYAPMSWASVTCIMYVWGDPTIYQYDESAWWESSPCW